MGQGNLTGYELFVKEVDSVIKAYPNLYKIESKSRIFLKGDVDIIDCNGKNWTTYSIEIHCSDLYPERFPNLFETGGKIPKIADWHIYEDTLSCCIKILPEEILRCKKGISLLQYFEEEVMPYLFNQTHRMVEGYYVNGEYSHGYLGLYEYYSSMLKTSDLRQIAKNLHSIATIPCPVRTSLCFCGSRIKYRYCHRDSYQSLSELGKDLLIDHATIFLNLSNKFEQQSRFNGRDNSCNVELLNN